MFEFFRGRRSLDCYVRAAMRGGVRDGGVPVVRLFEGQVRVTVLNWDDGWFSWAEYVTDQFEIDLMVSIMKFESLRVTTKKVG